VNAGAFSADMSRCAVHWGFALRTESVHGKVCRCCGMTLMTSAKEQNAGIDDTRMSGT